MFRRRCATAITYRTNSLKFGGTYKRTRSYERRRRVGSRWWWENEGARNSLQYWRRTNRNTETCSTRPEKCEGVGARECDRHRRSEQQIRRKPVKTGRKVGIRSPRGERGLISNRSARNIDRTQLAGSLPFQRRGIPRSCLDSFELTEITDPRSAGGLRLPPFRKNESSGKKKRKKKRKLWRR